jgi:hypothetical protein
MLVGNLPCGIQFLGKLIDFSIDPFNHRLQNSNEMEEICYSYMKSIYAFDFSMESNIWKQNRHGMDNIQAGDVEFMNREVVAPT